ncbi:hypothetical protein HYU15_02410 [Candidatus Woesearchaeota archaeon]|nr:hypothetical protein [Candidatus Woesearchaeota archaeon]
MAGLLLPRAVTLEETLVNPCAAYVAVDRSRMAIAFPTSLIPVIGTRLGDVVIIKRGRTCERVIRPVTEDGLHRIVSLQHEPDSGELNIVMAGRSGQPSVLLVYSYHSGRKIDTVYSPNKPQVPEVPVVWTDYSPSAP